MGDENLLLYLNLTGELFYIVAHRMKSQRVKVELAKKVFNDLGLAICSPSRLQALISGDISLVTMRFDQVKALMDQIAHCSIMTVNQYSLEKLFELVMISTKYQFAMCQHPQDVLLIVLNHLDSMRRVLTDLHVIRLAEDLHNVLIITYGKAGVATMKNYMNSIRNYVQEVRLKMTNLIKLGLQAATGEFITHYPPDFWIHQDCVKPGHIECMKRGRFGQKAKKILITFDAQNQSAVHRLSHSLGMNGNRVISLGKSVYDREGPSITYDDMPTETERGFDADDARCPLPQSYGEPEQSAAPTEEQSEQSTEESDLLDVYKAVQGLDLCSQMLGVVEEKADEETGQHYRGYESEYLRRMEETGDMNLKEESESVGVNVVKIDARCRTQGRETALKGLADIAKEFDVEQERNAEEDGKNEEDNMFDFL